MVRTVAINAAMVFDPGRVVATPKSASGGLQAFEPVDQLLIVSPFRWRIGGGVGGRVVSQLEQARERVPLALQADGTVAHGRFRPCVTEQVLDLGQGYTG